MTCKHGPLRVGIGGPVGSGKTTLTEKLCKAMRDRWSVAVITNDIYTREDALILNRLQALPEDRILGVETGGCPHTAIREDASINLRAIAELNRKFPDLDIVFIESGGDNLAATFSPDLADITIYVISVAQGEKIPRKGGPAIGRAVGWLLAGIAIVDALAIASVSVSLALGFVVIAPLLRLWQRWVAAT